MDFGIGRSTVFESAPLSEWPTEPPQSRRRMTRGKRAPDQIQRHAVNGTGPDISSRVLNSKILVEPVFSWHPQIEAILLPVT